MTPATAVSAEIPEGLRDLFEREPRTSRAFQEQIASFPDAELLERIADDPSWLTVGPVQERIREYQRLVKTEGKSAPAARRFLEGISPALASRGRTTRESWYDPELLRLWAEAWEAQATQVQIDYKRLRDATPRPNVLTLGRQLYVVSGVAQAPATVERLRDLTETEVLDFWAKLGTGLEARGRARLGRKGRS